MRRERSLKIRFSALVALLLVFAATTAFALGQVQWQKNSPQRVGGQAIIMWNALPGALKYSISRTDMLTNKTVTWETQSLYYVDLRAESGKAYKYLITAVGADGRPLGVSESRLLEAFKPLEPPRWGGSYQEGGRLYLVWDGDPRAKFHNLYRIDQGAKGAVKIASVQTGKYVDSNILPKAKYTYYIRSVDRDGKESEPSNYLDAEVETWEGAPAVGVVAKRYVNAVGMIVGQANSLFSEPTDMVFRRGKLFVTDMGSRAIQEFTPEGALVRRIGVKPPNYPKEWGIPWGMDSDIEGKVFAVTYLKTPYVRIFDRNGKMILDLEVFKPNELKDYPLVPQAMDVLLDGNGGFWVSEFSYGQLIHYDERGTELLRVGTPKFLEEGEPFKTPTFLARQPKTGDIWVSESLQGRIYRITQEGEIIGFMDNRDSELGVLIMPKDIAPGREGELLVIDGMLGSLQSFDENGNLVAVYYTPELEYLELPSIVAVAYDHATGDIYVSSKIESAIFKLQLIQ
jgi:hypothetical protein